MPQGWRVEGRIQKSLHQVQAEIYVLFDLNVVAVVVGEEMCFHLTCENTNKRVPAVSLIETLAANGAQVENQTPDLRVTRGLVWNYIELQGSHFL